MEEVGEGGLESGRLKESVKAVLEDGGFEILEVG